MVSVLLLETNEYIAKLNATRTTDNFTMNKVSGGSSCCWCNFTGFALQLRLNKQLAYKVHLAVRERKKSSSLCHK